jgi:hypothetical protein
MEVTIHISNYACKILLFSPNLSKLKCSRQVLGKPPKIKFRPLGNDMFYTWGGRKKGQADRRIDGQA